MKKNIIAIAFLWVLSVFLYAEDLYKKIFGKYIDKDYVCYDFVVHNPTLFSGMYYYPQIKKMRNQILFRKDSSYWINNAGYKLWSDSDVSDISYTYSNIDSLGHIDRMDSIQLRDNKKFYDKRSIFYTLTKNQYIISYFSENSKKEKIEVYDIVITNDSLILKSQNYNYLYQYEYKPGVMIFRQFNEDVLEYQNIFEYKGDSLINSVVMYYGNLQGELEQKIEYKNGKIIKETRPLPDGEAVYYYNSESGLRVYTEIRNGKSIEGSIYKEDTTYSPLGFISSKRLTPVGKETGDYKIIDYYLLPQKDDVLKEYFSNWPEKR